jgi:non-ribosomal peptide synthetase component F
MITEQVKSPSVSKNVEAIYPLSPMQQGMLFHSLYAPQSGVYVEQITLTLKGNVKVAVFKYAWQKVVDRYSILRTSFIWENRSNPLQVVLKQVDLPWINLDWLSLSSAAQQQKLSELLQAQREQGFELNRAPLMGCTLIQLTDDTYQFIWSFHHILLDGWCLPIIFKEVLSFYEAEIQGETCHLPTPVPYRDYIAWLNAQDRAAATEFWREALYGFSTPTPFRVDLAQHQSQQQDSNYRELELRLSADVSSKLQTLAQQQHVTLSTIIQAAWGLLLSRYSGEPGIVFGVTISGRPASLDGVENMVGLFINTLPLRLQISSDQQLISWLEQIQQLMLELQQYSYTPLVEIQSLSDVPGGILLFESIVVFENYPMDSSLADETGSLLVGKIENHDRTNFPLTVSAKPGDELSIEISYDPVRFADDTIERMLGHLQTIFCAIATNPHQTLSELPLLSEFERQQLLFDWNDTQTDYPQDKCIHQLFEEQVAKTPDAIAVAFDNQKLTYEQLDRRANQLAHYLQDIGVKPEVLVGICCERSIEMVVGLLGILKSGGVYVPIDPTYPSERLNYIINDAAVEILLTQKALRDRLPKNHIKVFYLEETISSAPVSSSLQPCLAKPHNLAYVIYTSGSTGQPKGAMIEHRGCVNHCYAMIDSLALDHTDTIAQTAPIGFDISVWQVLTILLVGGKVEILNNEIMRDPTWLCQELQKQKISILQVVPSLLKVMLEVFEQSDIPNLSYLRWLLVTGEAFPANLLDWWFELYPYIPLMNAYGPAECSDDVTLYPIYHTEN